MFLAKGAQYMLVDIDHQEETIASSMVTYSMTSHDAKK